MLHGFFLAWSLLLKSRFGLDQPGFHKSYVTLRPGALFIHARFICCGLRQCRVEVVSDSLSDRWKARWDTSAYFRSLVGPDDSFDWRTEGPYCE